MRKPPPPQYTKFREEPRCLLGNTTVGTLRYDSAVISLFKPRGALINFGYSWGGGLPIGLKSDITVAGAKMWQSVAKRLAKFPWV